MMIENEQIKGDTMGHDMGLNFMHIMDYKQLFEFIY